MLSRSENKQQRRQEKCTTVETPTSTDFRMEMLTKCTSILMHKDENEAQEVITGQDQHLCRSQKENIECITLKTIDHVKGYPIRIYARNTILV